MRGGAGSAPIKRGFQTPPQLERIFLADLSSSHLAPAPPPAVWVVVGMRLPLRPEPPPPPKPFAEDPSSLARFNGVPLAAWPTSSARRRVPSSPHDTPPAGRRATAEPLHRHRLHSLCATRAYSQSYTRISGTPLRRPRSDLAPTSSSHRPVCRLHARHGLSSSFLPALPLPPSSLPPPRSSHLPISHPPWRS